MIFFEGGTSTTVQYALGIKVSMPIGTEIQAYTCLTYLLLLVRFSFDSKVGHSVVRQHSARRTSVRAVRELPRVCGQTYISILGIIPLTTSYMLGM